MTAHKQTTDNVSYSTSYNYFLNGGLQDETYPSWRLVNNVLKTNGDLDEVKSSKCGTADLTNATCPNPNPVWSYANTFSYNAAGAVTAMKLGNGLWESTVFNSRLQPTQIALGTTQNATDKLKLNYDYGGSANNGNVLSQTITVPTVGANTGFTAVQSYEYDSLNRLKDATENVTPHGGSQSQSWRQAFTFDRYGNRNFDESLTTTLPKECNGNTEVCEAIRPIVNPSVNTTNNRLNGYTFDASGNTTVDAENRIFIYDAENKQIEVRDSQQNVIGQYRYDGDGKRVKKIVPSTGEVTVFVYDAGAKLIGEYSTIVATTEDAKVAYLTADRLGSPRINTDRDGNVTSRRDFHPFGEKVYTAERTSELGYDADTIRKQFTGYDRDIEIDLDFAQARYYNNQHGRFTTADEPFVGQDFENPQTINLYTYTSNNPINRVDPDGHRWFIRDVDIDGQMTRQVVWVNPNDDGSYTTPDGEGWQAFIPTENRRTFALGLEANRVIYLGENADGSPIVGRALWTGAVQSADEDIITAVPLLRGAWSVAKGIFGKALTSWAQATAVRSLTTSQINTITEVALSEFAKHNAIRGLAAQSVGVDDVVAAAGKLVRKSGGWRQGWIHGGDAKQIFENLAGQAVQGGRIRLGDGTVVIKRLSKDKIPTLYITKPSGQKIKIRVPE